MVVVTGDNGLPLIFSRTCANGAFRFPSVSRFREICLPLNFQGWRVQLCVFALLEGYPASPASFERKWFSPFHPVKKTCPSSFESKILHMPALAFFCPHSWRRFSWPAHTFGSPNSYLNVENLSSPDALNFVSKRKSLSLLMFSGNFSKTFPLVLQGQCGQC